MDSIWINGKVYRFDDYLNDPTALNELDHFEKKVLSFSVEWLGGREIFQLNTSGSTGSPKVISIHRDQLVSSARMTIDFLKLQPGTKALLCLDPEYIAGIMMMVRSFSAGMSIYALSPSSNPMLQEDLDYSFELTAVVPYQVSEILHHSRSAANFKKIRYILIGGSDMHPSLIEVLSQYPNSIFQSFGMTETVSHIALKRLSGKYRSDYYEVMCGIKIGTDIRGCLTVCGQVTGGNTIVTNDLVDLIDNRHFRWKGRIDDVIVTGGIKVNIRDLELRIHEIFIQYNISGNYFISKLPDIKLGDKIILLLEKKGEDPRLSDLRHIFRTHLEKYEIPKEIYTLVKFKQTKTGKIDKKATLNQLGIDIT